MRGRDVEPEQASPTSDPSDDALVARAQGGDRAAFRALIERHQRRIYQLALGIVKQHEDAMDVVQDTFVKVHQHLAGFKGHAAFSTWTYRIAYNLSIDALRKTNRSESVDVDETTLTDEGSQYEPYASGSASPQKALLRGELSTHLQRALDQLSENHRAILIMREVDGMSYEQLADILNIPKGTVMSRLFHARHKMQQALQGYLKDDSPTPGTAALESDGGRP